MSTRAQLELIKHRGNAVFSVRDTKAGRRAVIRVHRANYHSDAELLSELQSMQALESSGILTPDVIPTRDGKLFETVRYQDVPEPWQTDLVAWIDGKPLDVIEDDAISDEQTLIHNFQILRELTGRVHNQASSWASHATRGTSTA